MKYSQSIIALVAAAGLSTAAPLAKRQAYAITDADIVCAPSVEHVYQPDISISSTML